MALPCCDKDLGSHNSENITEKLTSLTLKLFLQ